MTQTRYNITTKGSSTIVHRLGRAVGPIVRGTSFGRPVEEARHGTERAGRSATRKRKQRGNKS